MFNKKHILLFILCMPALALAQDRIVIDGVTYRDPTQPVGAQRQSLEEGTIGRTSYAVTFIRTGGQQNVAVVNGQTVGVGDTVDGASVMAINSDSVTLDVDGESIDISTFRATFRTAAP